ncbi:MAG: valine--tRNA ligase, partial [Candidatus Bathyarchaeota archaeon]|nr:valine--tRNA ligase [Candidatus Termitimicrobium sp.]
KQIPPAKKISVTIQPADKTAYDLYQNCKNSLGFLSGAATVEVQPAGQNLSPDGSSTRDVVFAALSNGNLYVPLEVDTEKEKARLTKEKQKLQAELSRVEGKLNNEGFMQKAPESLIAEEREKKEKFAAMLLKVEAELAAL